MSDNTTAHSARDYDREVVRTIPHYDTIHAEVLDLVRAVHPEPRTWLDTGCGTGALAARALILFPRTRFALADPCEAMLDQAHQRIGPNERVTWLPVSGTADVLLPDGRQPEVITAVLCHHYLGAAERERCVARCRALLPEGGLFVSVEVIAAATERGQQVGIDRWSRFQIGQGRSESDAAAHMARCGEVLHPISIEEHLALLRRVGFRSVEPFWLSVLQAGFYGIR